MTTRLLCTAGIDSSRPSRTNGAQHAGDVFGRVLVLGRTRRACGFGARRERERLTQQVVGPVVAAHDEAGVDEALQRLPRGARVEAAVGADLVGLGRAEHERGEHAPPVLVGEEADELASLERRIGHNG